MARTARRLALCTRPARSPRNLSHRYQRNVFRDAERIVSGHGRAMGRRFRRFALCGAVAGRNDSRAYIALGIGGASARNGITWAAAIWGIAIAAFGLARSLWLALTFLAAAGAADMVSGIFRMAIWNQTIPASIRGRTAAIEMVIPHRAVPRQRGSGPRRASIRGSNVCRLGRRIMRHRVVGVGDDYAKVHCLRFHRGSPAPGNGRGFARTCEGRRGGIMEAKTQLTAKRESVLTLCRPGQRSSAAVQGRSMCRNTRATHTRKGRPDSIPADFVYSSTRPYTQSGTGMGSN